MLKLLLPPNFPSAAERDAIPVRLQLDLSQTPTPGLLPALALLQRWCGNGPPPAFIQLSRKQMRELLESLRGQPAFAYVRSPEIALEWQGDEIPALSPFVREKEQPKAAAASAAPLAGKSGYGFKTLPSHPGTEASGPDPSAGSLDGSENFLAVSMPPRERPGYASLLELLKSAGFVLEPSNRRWWLRERHKVLSFLSQHRARLLGEYRLEPTANFTRNTAHLQQAEFVCSAQEAGDGFSLTLAIRAGGAPEPELRAALASNRGYVEHAGRIYLLDTKRLQEMAEAQRALTGDPSAGLVPTRSIRIRGSQVPEAGGILEELSPNFEPPASWVRRSEALRSLSKLQAAPLPPEWERLLRPYQRLGVAWLWYLQQQGLGAILADEMGLGKTLQALGLLQALSGSARGRGLPRLVVAPASLLENWRRETARFAPGLSCFVHHGDSRFTRESDFAGHDLVITSYGTLTRDRELFAGMNFDCVIADEAQHIKNRRSLNAQSLRSLNARARFLLTGTPLENSLDDLRSLFDFLMPGFLPTLPPGLKREDKTWHDKRLLARTAPYILRRTKASVAPELPPKIEQVIWCELEASQAALYRRTQETSERELLDLEAGGASEGRLRFAMLTQLLRLRQICCDPRLAPASRVASEAEPSKGSSHRSSSSDVAEPHDSLPPGEPSPQQAELPTGSVSGDSALPTIPSAKLGALVELLEEAVDDGHRVLIFSQFTRMLDLLGAELAARDLSFCRLDGSMAPKARQAEVDRFQSTPGIPVFLLSLKAGGTGLNLTGADTVVLFDPWWNPAGEMQATDRAHRIGQTRAVTSYKLICSGTVEEKVLALQEEKRALLAEVFDASDEAASRLSLGDLRELLRPA